MPPKIEVTAAANGKGKKITREDVETPQSAPPKQVQKKVTSMGDGTQSPAGSADGVGGSVSVKSQVRDPTRVQEQGVLGGEEKLSQTSQGAGGGLGATSFDEIIVLIKNLSLSQEAHQKEMELLARENSERISALEKELTYLEPAVAERFVRVENQVMEDERGSVASFQEIQEIENQLQTGAKLMEFNQQQQANVNQQQAELNLQQEARNQQQDRHNADIADAVRELTAEIKRMQFENMQLREKTEWLEKELDIQIRKNREGLELEKERSKIKIHPSPINTWSIPGNYKINRNNQFQPEFKTSKRNSFIQTPNISREPEDVEMEEAPPDYDQVVPMFDGKNMDVSSFIFRCMRHYEKYQHYYLKNPKQMVIYIEDHLTGGAERWYRIDEMYEQKENPDPERLLKKLEEEYSSERDLEDVKNLMLRLRHDWGKAYEYLSEFNQYSRILKLDELHKKLVLSWQVRPSVREALYDLPSEEQTFEGYVRCLKKCDSFPSTYKIDYLERNDTPANRTLSLMGVLGIMDPMRPSKVVELRKKKKDRDIYSREETTKDKPRDNPLEKHNEQSYPKEEGMKHPPESKEGKENNYGGNSRRNSYWKDKRSNSNNPIPKSYAVQEAPSETYEPLARFEKLDGQKFDEPVSVMYDSGSQINVMSPALAKKIGLKVRKEPNTYVTIAGKVTLPYITEDFKIKLWLMNRQEGRAKWYEFTTSCRLAEGGADDLLIGSRFTDKHYIYRGFDEKDWRTKVFKIDRPGEKSAKGEEEAKRAYRIEEIPTKGKEDMFYPGIDKGKTLNNPTESNIKHSNKDNNEKYINNKKWYIPKFIKESMYRKRAATNPYLYVKEVSGIIQNGHNKQVKELIKRYNMY